MKRSYYKMRQLLYKMWQCLLQNAPVKTIFRNVVETVSFLIKKYEICTISGLISLKLISQWWYEKIMCHFTCTLSDVYSWIIW